MNPHPPLPNHPTNQPSNYWSLENFAEVGRRWKMELTSKIHSLKLTNSNLKMDAWEKILSFWGPAYFSGVTANSASFYLRKFTDLILSLFDFF